MRFIPALVMLVALTGCELVDSASTPKAVDSAALAPLSGREQALILGADGAAQQGNYAAAERDYLSAVAASTGHVEAHLGLARMYEKQRQPQKETEILTKALELQPKHPVANYMLGKLQLEANRYAEALETFRRGLVTRPDDIDLAMGEAVTQDMMGNHVAAQIIYQRVIGNNSKANLANVRTNLAMSYLLSGTPQKAVDLLKADIKKSDSSPVARHNLALAYGMLGKHTEAKKLLNGEVDEETRQLTLARMKEYLQQRKNDISAAPIQPTLAPAPATTTPQAMSSFP